MKKFILLNALLYLPVFILAMDSERSFTLIAQDDSYREVGRYEIGSSMAQNIPLMKKYLDQGTVSLKFPYATEKNLANFYRVAIYRNLLKDAANGSFDITESKNDQEVFLRELPRGEFAHLTIMTSNMYEEIVPAQPFSDTWQNIVNTEFKQKDGIDQFLNAYFPDDRALGTQIFNQNRQLQAHPEFKGKTTESRGALVEVLPRQQTTTFFAKCQAFFGRATKPVLGLTFFAVCAGLYKLLQQQGLLPF